MKLMEAPKPNLILKRKRIVKRRNSAISPLDNPINTSTYSAYTLKQRDEIMQTSAKLHAYCEPGSGDYNIPRKFDMVKE
jgi:hypothetical protein